MRNWKAGDRVETKVRDKVDTSVDIWRGGTAERVLEGSTHVRFDDGTGLLAPDRAVRKGGTITHRELKARPFDGEDTDGHFEWLQAHPDVDEIYLLGFDLPQEQWDGRPTIRVTFIDGRDPIEQQGLSFSSAALLFFVNPPGFRAAIPSTD
jgi:hypothetical protein